MPHPPATSQALSVLFAHFVVYAGEDRGNVLLRIITIKRFIWRVCIPQSQLLSALKAVSKLCMPEYLWAIVYIMEKSLTVIEMNKIIFLHGYCQKFFHNVNHILNMMKSFDRKESPFSFNVTESYLSWYAPKGIVDIPAFPRVFAWFCSWHTCDSVAELEWFIHFSYSWNMFLDGGTRVYAGYVCNLTIQEYVVALRSPGLLLWQ